MGEGKTLITPLSLHTYILSYPLLYTHWLKGRRAVPGKPRLVWLLCRIQGTPETSPSPPDQSKPSPPPWTHQFQRAFQCKMINYPLHCAIQLKWTKNRHFFFKENCWDPVSIWYIWKQIWMFSTSSQAKSWHIDRSSDFPKLAIFRSWNQMPSQALRFV